MLNVLKQLITLGVISTSILEVINIFQYKKQAEENLKKKNLLEQVDNMSLDELEKMRSELIVGEEDTSKPKQNIK